MNEQVLQDLGAVFLAILCVLTIVGFARVVMTIYQTKEELNKLRLKCSYMSQDLADAFTRINELQEDKETKGGEG